MNKEKELKLAREIERLLKDLDLVAVNLLIESAHIKEANGIKPIAETLREVIKRVEEDIHALVKDIENT